MTEKKMLIVDSEVAKKIEENRGDMSVSAFINFLIDGQLKGIQETDSEHNYVTVEEFQQFTLGMKDLLRNFLEFSLSYGLELGSQPKDKVFTELTQKLQALGNKAKSN